ncbi:MAG: hypothetical protein V4630_09020, partial [Pseudomonadota bacterium]
MVADFRRRFWVCVVLTVPVLVLSPMVRVFTGQGMAPLFAGEEWVALALSSIIYFWGGWPFLKGALPEIRSGRPGMMTLVALAISTAYFYSAAVTLGLPGGEPFYWELATLVTIMLLGHWLEMRSVLGASRALEELVRLLPDTALRVTADGGTEDVPVAALIAADFDPSELERIEERLFALRAASRKYSTPVDGLAALAAKYAADVALI